jgi:hypothetical protein
MVICAPYVTSVLGDFHVAVIEVGAYAVHDFALQVEAAGEGHQGRLRPPQRPEA